MPAVDSQILLEEAKCYLCLGVSLPEALKLALLSRISQGGGGGGSVVWGSITGTLSNQLDLQAAINAAAIAARPVVGAASPVGVVVPGYIGQIYMDTVTPALYQASGLTNADWINWI